MKLSSSLAYEDFYTPNDWAQLDNGGQVCFLSSCTPQQLETLAKDTDMGTGGVVLLNNSELVSVGKQGMVYVIPYSTSTNGYMGGLDGAGYTGTTGSKPQNTDCSTVGPFPSPGNIEQCFEATNFNPSNVDLNGVRGAPAFWSAGGTNQYIFPIGMQDRMYWYNYAAPTFNTSNPPQSDHLFDNKSNTGFAAGTASVTWNSGGNANTGIVWALDSNGYGTLTVSGSYRAAVAAELYAYPAIPGNATCGGGSYVCELWDSSAVSASMPAAVKFTVPTIVDGYILVGGGSPSYFGPNSTACPAPPPNNGVPTSQCAGQLTVLH